MQPKKMQTTNKPNDGVICFFQASQTELKHGTND
jgi:hypothetical protein